MKKIALLLCALSSFAPSAWCAPDSFTEDWECQSDVRPIRLGLRHIEGKGVGYSDGYTTAEGFFQILGSSWSSFADLRGHVFNDGKWAANAGLGLRYAHRWVYGINAYYDYRKTHHLNYNQVSVGLEMLGERFDFRLNGYWPIGEKKSTTFNTRFDSFSGNRLVLSSKYEFAMKGINAEAGFHLFSCKNVDLYAAAGPYYFGNQGKNAWGGEARTAFTFWRRLRLEANGSYDSVFKWIGQGQLGLYFPLGGKKKVKNRHGDDCSYDLMLLERSSQRVDRNEIIVVDRKREKTSAIDPNTGLPYTVWFVSNDSHSKGTFESPFPNLLQVENASAPNDIIYVFAGNGSSQGMNQGLRLKNNQRLLGAGIQHHFSTTLANINIPPQEAGLPQIDTSENTATIVLADHCEVAGLHVISSNGGFGILGGQASVNPTLPGITDALVQNNLISNVGNHGIVLNNCTGNLRIVDNIVSNISGTGVVVLNEDSLTIDSNIVIANNTISIASSGISIEHAGDGFIDFEIADNSAINMSSDAIGIRNRSTSSGNLCGSLLNNRTLAFAASAIKILATQASSTEIQIGNNVSLGSLNGFQAQTSDTAFLCLNLWNNTNQSHTLTQTNSSHFRLETSTGSIKGLQARNIGPFSTSGTIQYVIPGTCSCP